MTTKKLMLFAIVGLFGCGAMDDETEITNIDQNSVQIEHARTAGTTQSSQMDTASGSAPASTTGLALPATPETDAGSVCLCAPRCVGKTPAGRATFKNGNFVRCGC